MDKLTEIAKRSIEDYGFRQIAQWSPDDIVSQWELSCQEAAILKGPLKDELDLLPVPVEPDEYGAVQERLTKIVEKALG